MSGRLGRVWSPRRSEWRWTCRCGRQVRGAKTALKQIRLSRGGPAAVWVVGIGPGLGLPGGEVARGCSVGGQAGGLWTRGRGLRGDFLEEGVLEPNLASSTLSLYFFFPPENLGLLGEGAVSQQPVEGWDLFQFMPRPGLPGVLVPAAPPGHPAGSTRVPAAPERGLGGASAKEEPWVSGHRAFCFPPLGLQLQGLLILSTHF